jgi:Protein of unknown function (DUF1549)/Protein of unknown function (DUF1553)/Planctomycete cytochrome C
MKLKCCLLTRLVLILASVVLVARSHAQEADAPEQLFVRRVVPLLAEKCLGCHGVEPDKCKGGLDIRSHQALLRGGDSKQPAIVAGKAEDSPIYLAAKRTHDAWSPMPPKEADKLNAQQLEWLKQWIAGGAPWPDEARQKAIVQAANWEAHDGITVKTSGGESAEWTKRKYKPADLWAYQPVVKPPLRGANSLHPIDELIARPVASETKLKSCDARTFIRRATFDLTGLPPTSDEVANFEKLYERNADIAVQQLIDRLLASPHYGERMTQHWLDVVRYADSSGFANDFERGNAWRYRDFVVRSFNADKPYDQFIREQIAGDEIDPNNPEMLVATGFLRMGPWELTGMEVAKIARQRFLDDVTNSIGETFLAHSLQCARCHDHKFDPIPTGDYYAIQAVFATTQIAEREAPFLQQEHQQGFSERKFLELRAREYSKGLEQLKKKVTLDAARVWLAENKRDATAFEATVAELASAMGGEDRVTVDAVRQRMEAQKKHPDLIPPKQIGFSPEDFGNERIARKGLERLKWELERYEPYALAVYSGRTPDVKAVYTPTRMPANRMMVGELERTCILTGGNPFAVGLPVQPGVLSILEAIQETSIPDDIAGRRLAFANWVANAKNPLTTRAIVNRVWLWHFNEPLAGNPNNFGSSGKRPTHPELLDWLAIKFVEQGWSFKALHRLIMTSAAYRGNHGKPRRLSAEEIRDAMLFTTGELNPMLGGIPNRPEINLEAALQPRQVMGTFAAAWTPNPLPSQRHRRSLYALKLRGLPDPSMEVFNAPPPDFSCERREASTITPQVFSLFNGAATHARALALAHRVLQETTSDESAIRSCFLRVFLRQPNAHELRACLNHWQEIESLLGDTAPPRVQPPLEIRRDAVEENTGEKFSFTEKLHANAVFVADRQPADCNAHTRALADVCLALFNTNEFVYVY